MPKCAYCGVDVKDAEREHVIPSCLYPKSRGANSTVQRLTVHSCSTCNRGWSSDEAHFRNILAIAGEANDAVREIWQTKVVRSFYASDGNARLHAIWKQMIPVLHEGNDRHMVYPANDERVMRVVRKVIRGLCHHHGLNSPVPDEAVWADVLKYEVPGEIIEQLRYEHREMDIFYYRFDGTIGVGYDSAWLLTFFERTTFIGLVCRNRHQL